MDLKAAHRPVSLLAVGLVVAVVSVATVMRPAHAHDGRRSLAGRWGFAAAGTVSPPAVPSAAPAAASGTMVFDGAHGCRIADTIDVGGTATSRISTSCRYTVDADGRGSLVAEFPDEPAPVPLSFVVVRDGSELLFIRTDAVVAKGVAERQ
jgi:hypothetical protein